MGLQPTLVWRMWRARRYALSLYCRCTVLSQNGATKERGSSMQLYAVVSTAFVSPDLSHVHRNANSTASEGGKDDEETRLSTPASSASSIIDRHLNLGTRSANLYSSLKRSSSSTAADLVAPKRTRPQEPGVIPLGSSEPSGSRELTLTDTPPSRPNEPTLGNQPDTESS